MTITLTKDSTMLTLPPDLQWVESSSWFPVEQVVDRSITGAQIIQAVARTGGMPFTLQPPDESAAWATGDMVEQLKAWAAIPLAQLTLSFGGVDHTVIFRHQDGAMQADPVVFYRDAGDEDFYLITLRLLEL